MCTAALAHNDTLRSSCSSELAAVCTLKKEPLQIEWRLANVFTEMGRGSVFAVTFGPTYAFIAHNEKVSVNLTPKKGL